MVTTEPAVNANLTFDQIAAAAEKLTHVEQTRLRELLTGWMKARMDAFARELLEDGVIAALPPQRTDHAIFWEYQPVPVEGEPVSETIVKERR